jgi:amino acid transporter
LIAAIAGIDYGCAQFMVPLLGLEETQSHFLAVFGLFLVSHAVLNHVGIRTVARLNDFSAIYHVGGVAIVVLALAFFAPRRPVAFLFTETFSSAREFPYWFAFLGGLLQAQWTYTGYDASAHTIEETRNARVSAPGNLPSVAVSGFFGYLMLAFVTLAIGDLPATAAASNRSYSSSNRPSAARSDGPCFGWSPLPCGSVAFLCHVHLEDDLRLRPRRGMPFSHRWSHVSRRFRTPWPPSGWGGLAFLLPCLILALTALRPGHLAFSRLYPAVTGISTIGLYLSYGIPIVLKLRAVRRGLWTARADGPWHLGAWSRPVNALAALWIGFITVLFVLPPNELTGYIFGGTLRAPDLLFLPGGGVFRGPVPQARSREELQRMEAEFERQE